MSADFKYFAQIIGEVVASVRARANQSDPLAPYFQYGTYMELVESCQVKDNNQGSKYPLVWLVWDSSENSKKYIEPYMYAMNARVFIIHTANIDDTTDERYTAPIESILYPIFELFVDEIGYHPNISIEADYRYPVSDHAFWLNDAEGTFDVLSAIEIKLENLLMVKS